MPSRKHRHLDEFCVCQRLMKIFFQLLTISLFLSDCLSVSRLGSLIRNHKSFEDMFFSGLFGLKISGQLLMSTSTGSEITTKCFFSRAKISKTNKIILGNWVCLKQVLVQSLIYFNGNSVESVNSNSSKFNP